MLQVPALAASLLCHLTKAVFRTGGERESERERERGREEEGEG